MTKADLVAIVAKRTGIERAAVMAIVEEFMTTVKDSLTDGEDVFLRGFGTFAVVKRREKTGRDISRSSTIIIPAHNIPGFRPAKVFAEDVKKNVKIK